MLRYYLKDVLYTNSIVDMLTVHCQLQVNIPLTIGMCVASYILYINFILACSATGGP